jgi:hypothetical protein
LRINAYCYNISVKYNDGVKYEIKKTGAINLDDQFIVLTVNKKGEHNHLTSSNDMHSSSNNGENSNNGETINIIKTNNNGETSNGET